MAMRRRASGDLSSWLALASNAFCEASSNSTRSAAALKVRATSATSSSPVSSTRAESAPVPHRGQVDRLATRGDQPSRWSVDGYIGTDIVAQAPHGILDRIGQVVAIENEVIGKVGMVSTPMFADAFAHQPPEPAHQHGDGDEA